ncbi:hypothetical protein M4D81_18840 [Paenibacillus sp. p3-SID867]|nr:hypothetical protein [Paenibacillus sp. p3-SID867]MCT1401090.1 hypothetical protein [Paenibacillus sp. p3-SID867]
MGRNFATQEMKVIGPPFLSKQQT